MMDLNATADEQFKLLMGVDYEEFDSGLDETFMVNTDRLNESRISLKVRSKARKSPKRRSDKSAVCFDDSVSSPKKFRITTQVRSEVDENSKFRKKPDFPTEEFPEVGPLRLSDKLSVPASLNRFLRDYQRDGVRFLVERFLRNEGAILADDMGLGKTVQLIAFLSAIYEKHGDERDLERLKPDFLKELEAVDQDVARIVEEEAPCSSTPGDKDQRDSLSAWKPALIIAPLSVIRNWMAEFETWAHFHVSQFHGKHKEETVSTLKTRRAEIVLTTFETARDCMGELDRFSWRCVIVDEVHKIKSEKSKMTQIFKKMGCLRRYGLTGTPLQNDMTELWCLLDWANPTCLGSVEDFIEKFGIPLERGQQHTARKRQLAVSERKKKEFGNLRDHWMLRRTKELIKDQLPTKTDEVVFCPISDLQRKAYENVLNSSDMALVLKQWATCDCGSGKQNGKCCYSMNDRGQKVQALMLALLQLLLKISNNIALVLPKKTGYRDSKQIYADEDVEKMCFGGNDEYCGFSTVSERTEYALRTENSGKMAALNKLLELFHDQKDKILIFSYSVKLLNILERFVKSKKYRFRRLDGATKADERFEVVSEFNRDASIFVFLISTKAGGVGLNITGANKVIVFDPNWNPSHDLQAQDRAYRIGQTRNVSVYRLITAGTLEENIYLRQVHKQHLDKVAVRSEAALRLFDRTELFGFKNMIQLRTGKESLTEKLLKRQDMIRKKLIGLETAPYTSNTVEIKQNEELLDENVMEPESSENMELTVSDEHGAEYILQDLLQEETGEVDSVAEALKSTGVVHVHENRQLVDSDLFEDHITRCAVKAVHDGDMGYGRASDNCSTIKLELTEQKRCIFERELNKPRKLAVSGNRVLLYGQTPANVATAEFARIAAENCHNFDIFAARVVKMSSEERFALLASFYSEDIPESAALFNQVSTAFDNVGVKARPKKSEPRSKILVDLKESTGLDLSPEAEASSSKIMSSKVEEAIAPSKKFAALDMLLGLSPSPEPQECLKSRSESPDTKSGRIPTLDSLLDL